MERLFNWPWQPWEAKKRITVQVPDPNLYQTPNGLLIGHPATIIQLKQAIAENRNFPLPIKRIAPPAPAREADTGGDPAPTGAILTTK